MNAISNKKVKNAWVVYDLANSVYNLVITATIFPIYYQSVTSIKDANGNILSNHINFLGFSFKNTALYDFAIATAFLLVSGLVPLLSGIADFRGTKKRLMKIFCYIGGCSCLLMYFFDGNHVLLGLLTAIFACIGYSGSLVFYNSYLPDIASHEEQDKLSAKGFAMGYLGSSLLLIINLIMIEKFELFGFANKGEAIRVCFLLVGIWWIGFSQIPFYFLPNGNSSNKFTTIKDVALKGFMELKSVWYKLKQMPQLTRFLFAFFVYSMGVQTVMLVATHFAAEEIKMESGQLITTILIIQFLAMFGSYIFAWIAKSKGNVFMLRTATLIWAAVCFVTFMFVYTVTQFYFVAAVVGLVMGGIQSLSRSTYSKMLPINEEHTAYFSFYDVCEKMSIVFGMVIFGALSQITSQMRQPIVSLVIIFAIGFLLLQRVKTAIATVKTT